MSYSEDHIALAAEYALGTLDADERALVETMMIVDHGFMDVVDAWEHKLAPLHQMVGAVEPPAHVWVNIKTAAGLTGRQMPMTEPMPAFVEPTDEERHVRDEPPKFEPVFETLRDEREQPEPEIVVAPVATAEIVEPSAPQIAPQPSIRSPPSVPESSNVVELSSRRRGGAAFGLLMTAVAASLAAVVSLQAYRPELLPEQLRIKPKIQTVEVKKFVALLQQDASLPAFILTVDTTTKNFTVRKVGATSEPGKSFELWLISDKLQGKPRSLGVIGNSDFTIRPALAAYDNDTINKATYAVTVEQEGGSSTGAPTSAPVFTGKLVESVPALPAAPNR
ncbi:MAG: anti-sigma factor [Afipia sp.]|nr:anti-sigma factor [Afipia sp.]